MHSAVLFIDRRDPARSLHQERLEEQRRFLEKQCVSTGSAVKYVEREREGEKDGTFSIFGVPIYKTQSYFVRVREMDTECNVTGINLSPNPADSSTVLVTINRTR